MKKYYTPLLFVAFFLLGSLAARAQYYPPNQPEQDPCGALPICGNSFTTPYAYDGYGALNQMSQFAGGCYDESASVWLKIEVATAGDIVFAITPAIASNDYDFTVFNMTGVPCANLSYTQMVRCNGSQYGYTGLSPSGTGVFSAPGPFPAFNIPIAASAGDVYYILINNFTTTNVAGFTIDFAGSTATFVSGATPEFAAIATACSYSNDVTIHLSKPVKCSSIAPDGSDFNIPGAVIASAVGINCIPGGYADRITLTFASPLPAGGYVINAQVGSDGNTLLDLCDNALQIPESINFNVSPETAPAMISVDDPACYKARIRFDRKIKCSTVAANGSDFLITGPGPVTVIKATPVGCNANGLTDTVDLKFDGSIFTPGTYTISVQQGSDGDVIEDSCEIVAAGTINFNVSDQGGVIASVSPVILCEPGYVQLSSQALVPPPAATLECGLHGGSPTGTGVPFTVGTGTSGTATYTPFYSYYHDAKTQIVYSAADMQAAGLSSGTITQIAFNITQKNSIYPFNGFTIKMGCTNAVGVTSFISGLSTVYGPSSYTSTAGTNTFTLTDPFDWDGSSNIVIEICFDNTQYSPFPGNDLVAYTVSAPASTFTRYTDGAVGCAMTSTSGFGGATPNRPNITFTVVPPPPGVYGYTWTPGSFVADTTLQNTVAFVPQTSVYQVQIMDTFRCYRRDTTQVIVSERNPILVPSGDTSICAGETIQLNALGGANYEWFPPNGLSCTNCPHPTATPPYTTQYSVAIIDQYGCSDTLSVNVIVDQLPPVQVLEDSIIVKYGTEVPLHVTGAGQYLWSPASLLNNPTSPNPTVTVTEPMVITVQGLDTNGCASTDSVYIGVDYRDHLMVPTAFSPNGDGKNDIFRIANFSFQKLQEFRVFNRWGQEVFSTNDGKQGWDGTWKGGMQDPGVYQFIIRVAYPDGYVDTYKGDVTLIR